MRRLRGAAPLVTVAVTLASVTCAFPTDKSDKVFVTLTSPTHVVLRGQEMSIYAQAWQVTGADTQPITNVEFAFASGSGLIARVDKDCCGYATVTGVNSGNVDIIARAVAFEHAQEADLPLRVSNPLEIDSVRPATAHYGDVLTVYGVGVDSMFIASLGGVDLIEYPFSRLRDSLGQGRISFWVPPPAHSDSLFYLGSGVFGFDTAMTSVIKEDIFEPNDTVPAGVNLDLGGPWPGTALAPLLFFNPALAFEPQERGTAGEDWFRFSAGDTTQALTFFINYPSTGDTTAITRTFLVDSAGYIANGDPTLDPIEKFFGRDSADLISSDFQQCKGFGFNPAQAQRESTTIALKTLPSHALHVLAFFTRPQRYGLVVVRGYITADPRIQPDKYEENDMCHFTDSIPGQPSPASRIRVTSTPGFSDTMNIDNPFEVDWYRIEVPSHPLGDSVVFRLRSRPFDAAARDSSDIDIYVETVPGSTGPGVIDVGSSVNAGSAENMLLNLPAGSYYLAVVDYAGVAMRYSMCIRLIPAGSLVKSCALILPGPAVPGRSKSRPQPSASPAMSTARDAFLRPRRP